MLLAARKILLRWLGVGQPVAAGLLRQRRISWPAVLPVGKPQYMTWRMKSHAAVCWTLMRHPSQVVSKSTRARIDSATSLALL